MLEKDSTRLAAVALAAAALVLTPFSLGLKDLTVSADAITPCSEVPVSGVWASKYEAANPPANAIDKDISTRWSGYGIGTRLTTILEQQETVCSIDIAWYRGNSRVSDFVISVSGDGETWKKVYAGKSSGTTQYEQRYWFRDVEAKYVRVTVNGNSENNWASISEIDINGRSAERTVADMAGPMLQITNLASGTTIPAGTTAITGRASDPSGVSSVQIRLEGDAYKSATPLVRGDWSEWTSSLDVASSGSHTIYARATDHEGNTKTTLVNVTASSSDTSSGLDKFGIKKRYPTASGGNEWYVNMADPESDPLFRNLPSMTKQPDGSWRVSSSQVRMEAWSPNEKWLNVEITAYAKMVSGTPLIQLYSRGGHHFSDPDKSCEGSALKGRLYGNGDATWVKEVNHPAYTSNKGAVDATDRQIVGKWVGFKAVIYNIVENGKTYVRMESYIDDDVTDSKGNLVIKNNWKLASVVVDRGGWATTNSDFESACAPLNKDSDQQYRQRDEILSMPGGTSSQNLAAWRSDGLTWDWKYLSVREVRASPS